jgi:hypothetical protein
MFSHPLDPPSVKEARALEERYIAKWIGEARARGPSLVGATRHAAAAEL